MTIGLIWLSMATAVFLTGYMPEYEYIKILFFMTGLLVGFSIKK